MDGRPKRASVPPARFQDYTQFNTSSSEELEPIPQTRPLGSMAESMKHLRFEINGLRDDTSMIEQTQNSTQCGLGSFAQPELCQSSGERLLSDIERREAEFGQQNVGEQHQQQDLRNQAAQYEEEQRQPAELAKQTAQYEEEHRQQEERAKQATQQREEQPRRHELARQTTRYEEEQRQTAELAKQTAQYEEEHRQQEERAKQATQQREEQPRRHELARQPTQYEEEQRQQAELSRQTAQQRTDQPQQEKDARQAAPLREEQPRRHELARQTTQYEEEQRQQAELSRQTAQQRTDQPQQEKDARQAARLREEQPRRHELARQTTQYEEEQRQRAELSRQTAQQRTDQPQQEKDARQAGQLREEQPRRHELARQTTQYEEEQRQRPELSRQTAQQRTDQRQQEEDARQAAQLREEQPRRHELARQHINEQQTFLQLGTSTREASPTDDIETQLAHLDGNASDDHNAFRPEEGLHQQRKELMQLESVVSRTNNRTNIGLSHAEAFLNPGYGNGAMTSGQRAHFIAPMANNDLLTQVLQSIREAQRDHHQYCVNQFRNINNRIDRIAGLLEREPEFPTKPDVLPMTTRQGIEDFDTASDEQFREVVQFLAELGGFTLNETANFIVKNAIEDSLSPSITWQGREPGTLKLQDTKLAKAFYAAVTRNKAFAKPNLKEFRDAMTAALKSSKQRNRNRQPVGAANRRPREEHNIEGNGDLPAQRRRRIDNAELEIE